MKTTNSLNIKLAKFFVNHDYIYDNSEPPLSMAALNGDLNTVKYLVEKQNANINENGCVHYCSL